MPSVPIPKDAVVDTSVPIPDGSIFDRPKTPDSPSTAKEIPGRLKQAGRSIAEFAAGTALPIAASMAGPEGKLAQVGAQAAAGAATPFVEAGVSKLMGGNPSMPSLKDVIRSAAFTGGVAALGAIPEAGKGAKVAGQIKGLPEEAQTVGNVKQAMRNRDFWIQSGASPEQADQIVTMPQTDLEALTQQSVKAGQDFKGAFQQVLDHQRGEFKARYDAVLGEHGGTMVDAGPIGQQFEQFGKGEGQHELTPTFRGFLQRKGLELTKAGETGGPSVGGVAWKDLPQKLKDQIKSQGGQQGVVPPTGEMSINSLRELRTELRENVPSNPSNLDKQAANQLNTQLTQTIDSKLAESGAKPEQIAAMHSLDEEYGRFQDTIKKLDPRSGKFGSQISDLLFDKQLSNPEQAVNFVRMAQAAEQAHPGEVMPQLRASFMDHVLSETKQQAQGRPVEEMRLIQNLQKQWGGDKNARAVMGAVFGADSPMANMTTASKVLGSLANPDAVAAKGAHTVLSDLAKGVTSHNFIVRLALFYGTYRAIAGGTGSPWKDLGDPEKMIPPLMAMMVGGKMADFALGAADTQIQKAYVDFLLNPNSKSLSNVTSVLGGISGAASGRPELNAPANP
jgi:hypothetical protein